MNHSSFFTIRCQRSTALAAMFGMVALLGVGAPQQASAEFFQFSTTVTAGALPPGTSITNNGTAQVDIVTPAPALTPITLYGLDSTALGGDNIDAGSGGSDIVVANIKVLVNRNTPLQSPFTLPLTFHVNISDYSTDFGGVPNASGTFNVTGLVQGTIGPGTKVNLSSYTVDPIAPLTIGGEVYTLSLASYVPPGPLNLGAFGFHVAARAIDVPEPSTLVLLGGAALILATPAIRRRRRTSR